MKLLLASPHFFPSYGGAQMRFMGYLPGFRERGIVPSVVTGTPMLEERTERDVDLDWFEAPVGDLLPCVQVAGADVHRVRLPDKKGLRRALIFNRTVVRLCDDAERRPDVVQFLTNLRARAIPWIRMLRRRGIPVVYSVSQYPTWPFKARKRLYRGWVYKSVYDQLDCLVTNSDPLRDFLLGLGVKTRVEVIPNGVNLRRYNSPSDVDSRRALRASLGIGDEDLLITTVGAVIPRKGADLLLEAWGRLAGRFPEAHLAFVGPRSDLHDPKLVDFRARLEGLLTRSGAKERVHFVGLVENVEEHLRAADIFTLPSQREGMPNSVLEAMATGLPSVLTRFIGFSERIGRPDEHFLLVERDAEALAAGLERLLESATLRRALGKKARQWILETLDVDRSLDRYAQLYRELAALSKA